MTDKQRLFVENYLIDQNATQAYLKSYPGVKATTAASNGEKLLRNTEIANLIKEGMDKKAASCEITKDYLIQQAQDILMAQKNGNPSASLKAIELIGKMLGHFESKLDITTKGNPIQINFNLTEDEE